MANDLAVVPARAIAKEAMGLAEAVADCDAAITLMEGLRDGLATQGLAWPPEFQSGLATAYLNRGNAKRRATGPAEAMAL